MTAFILLRRASLKYRIHELDRTEDTLSQSIVPEREVWELEKKESTHKLPMHSGKWQSVSYALSYHDSQNQK